ncbi:hypothetical protein DFJ63DRAFT_203563 [Scheffersomyces coipomensis]|uniref:uncharacterized protein n=1 Tax=Scheffersomyces coipomensis TaxID=1788519 RepID=UPI00315CD1B7
MIYFEANITTTIPTSPSMYSNSNNNNQQYLGDYSYHQQQAQAQQQQQQQQQIPSVPGANAAPPTTNTTTSIQQQSPRDQLVQPSTSQQQSHTILPPPATGSTTATSGTATVATGATSAGSYHYQPTTSGSSSISGTIQTNPNITNKFSAQDVQILKQLLVAGEKHKWKQITKEINQSSSQNIAISQNHQHQQEIDPQYATQSPKPQAKNVSPTFVIKQYQTLLGLPNNSLYFGTLGSSLPYVTAPNGWEEIVDQGYHNFGTDDIE